MNSKQKKTSKSNNPNGRPKGSLNARTSDLLDISERLKCNPFEVLIHFAKGDFKALGYDHHQIKVTKDGTTVSELTISPELRQRSAKDACEYLFPKRKAVEHTFDSSMPDEDLINETAKLLKAVGAMK